MRRPPLVPALTAFLAAAIVAACGSKSQPSPTSPASSSNAVAVSVTESVARTGAIKPADVIQLRATTHFADGSTADCTSAATWSTANASVARLSSTKPGEVTAIAGGATTITAHCGALPAELAMSVLALSSTSTTLAGAHAPQLIVGERVPVEVSSSFADGSSEACTTALSWSSSNPAAVTIGTDGVAVAVGTGTATITSTCRFSSNSLGVTVRPGLRIRGLENEPFVLLISPHINIYTDQLDDRGNVVAPCNATFRSSDPTVLGIVPAGSGGTIVPLKLGEATITATCGANAAATTVRVARYNIVGTVRQSDGTPIAGATVEAYLHRYSDTEAPTSATTSAADGSYVLPADISPANITVTASGYDPTTLPAITWTRQPTMQVADAQLTPTPPAAPPPHLLDFSDTVCNAANFPTLCSGSTLVKGRDFPGYTSGRLRVETSLESVPSNASVVFALYCGHGSSVDLPYQWESDTVRYYQLPGGCSTYYELRVSNMSTYPKVTFHVTADIK